MKKLLIFASLTILLSITPISFAENEDKVLVLHTKSGKLVIEFFPNDAPKHVKNFIDLTESGFYEKTVFHRVIEDFMIQGGDPKSKPGEYQSFTEWGTGNPGYSVDAEFNDIKHNRGIVSMARSMDPNSAGSQFFIVHKDSNFLDGQYTVFGRLITQESFETLDKIATMDTPYSLGEASQNEIGATIPVDWGETEIQKAEVVSRASISNVLELGEPERTSSIETPDTQDAKYSNDKLGISFIAPQGWPIQEPQKTHSGVPDIVIVGPAIGSINPTISISAIFANGRTLDDYVKEIEQTLQSSIDAGLLEITSLEKTTVNGNEAHVRNAIGVFERNNSTINVQFKEINILASDKIYTLTYSNDKENFDNSIQRFETIINTLDMKNDETNIINQNEENGGGCLIATATFGSEMSPQVQHLREIRDNIVMQTQSGAAFLNGFNQLYYSFSPAIADLERENLIFKEIIKISITPLLASLSLLNYVDIDTEAEMLGYGLGIISLNIGFYFGLPAVIIQKFRK